MAATLTQSPHALHAQTTSPIHNVPAYEIHDDLELHTTNPSLTSTIMDQHINTGSHLALPPLSHINDNDSTMEGAEDTAGSISPIAQSQHNFRNSSVPNTPTTHVNVFDLPDAVDVPSPEPEPLSPGHPPSPPALTPARGGSVDEDEEEEDEDEARNHVSDERARSFYPFNEDTTSPDAEELRNIRATVEHGALDDHHWQSETFFDLQDPQLVPKDQGKIEWTVENFNGTKDNPRKSLLLTSHIVRIGGHDWRIKLLPHGNMQTDRLSLYVENVSVQSSVPQEWPADKLPLPVLGDVKVMKHMSVAAQISILVYNPEEPRVNEFKAGASQFSRDSPDHGWTRFTSLPWYDIHRRHYAQRQPLLRNDTLAIKAFIRVIDDPTGCLWAPKDLPAMVLTGLHPFCMDREDLALCPILALWLHLRPFREVLYKLGAVDLFTNENDGIVTELQSILWRMRSRIGWDSDHRHAPYIGDFLDNFQRDLPGLRHVADAMETMDIILAYMRARLKDNKDALENLSNLFGTDSFSGDRLTKRSIIGKTSMQEIVDEGLPEVLLQNEVLTLELERQVFDSKKRVWKKLLNKVRLDDQITVKDGSTYTLYGFVAHEGYLRNGEYTSHFRPGGPDGLWYTYMHNKEPACQTRAQAVESKEGVSATSNDPLVAVEEPITSDSYTHGSRPLDRIDAVAYVVLYVRNPDIFNLAAEEPWDVPQWIPQMYGPQPQTDVTGATNDSISYDDTASDNQDEEMNEISAPSSPRAQPSGGDLKQVKINYLSNPFYEGQVNNASEYHGLGHLMYLNGDEYQGNFDRSQRSGHGRMLYANNDTYDGQWAQDQPHGHGTYTYHRTGNVYTGNWQEGKRFGTGTMYYKVSEEEAKLCRICYGQEADAALYDCGHVCACVECAKRVTECPVCRRRIKDVVKLFYST
ncbi:hypothetical protein E4T48_00086 [Aureobasidium sp. EXF-10727]|nr:hypothetical protein E4T48_00086 [Aureobasidium sp. EXF-10727]